LKNQGRSPGKSLDQVHFRGALAGISDNPEPSGYWGGRAALKGREASEIKSYSTLPKARAEAQPERA
jgi:hypothetical protein